MPCNDSSARIAIEIDSHDRVTGFEYHKITCNKEIGGYRGFENLCRGRSVEELSRYAIEDALEELKIENDDDRFLVFLEWDALRAALQHYLGLEIESPEPDRFQIASVMHTGEGVEIVMVVRPPRSLPPILACASKS